MFQSVQDLNFRLGIPAWYINKFTIIDFTIYTRLFLVKLKRVVDGPILHSKSVVDGPILHSKSVVDRSILHSKAKVCVFSVFMMVKLLIYHTGMCIKVPENWWIAKSITPQLVVNQSKVNPQRPKGDHYRFCNPPTFRSFDFYSEQDIEIENQKCFDSIVWNSQLI